jgi:PAS domain S-box-containing protein
MGVRSWIDKSFGRRVAVHAVGNLLASSLLLIAVALAGNLWLLQRQEERILSGRLDQLVERLDARIDLFARATADLAANPVMTTALLDSRERDVYLRPFLKSFRLPVDEPHSITLCDFTGKPLAGRSPGGSLKPAPLCYANTQPVVTLFASETQQIQLRAVEGRAQVLVFQPVFYPGTGHAEGYVVATLDMMALLESLLGGEIESLALFSADGTIHVEAGLTEADSRPWLRDVRPGRLDGHYTLRAGIRPSLPEGLGVVLAFYGLAVLVMGAVSWQLARRMARRLTRPLAELSRSAAHIAHEGAGSQMIKISGRDEISALAFSLNTMLASLTRARDHLEEQVASRTRDLDEALAIARRSEERYRALFSHAKVTMLLVDPKDGAIVDANQAAAAYYGWDRDSLMRMSIIQINILHPDQVAAEMARAKAENRNHFFFRHRLQSGEVRDVEVHSGPLELDGKTLLFSVVHDITERRRSEEIILRLNAQLQSVMDAASEVSIIATDTAGLITLFNRGAERMLGFKAEAMVGVATPLAFHDPDECAARAAALRAEDGIETQGMGVILNAARRRGQDGGEWTYIRADGARITVYLVVTPIRDAEGHISGYLGVAQDISDRKRAEEKAAATARKLEELADRLARQNAELEQFAYVASHDLRQPLRMVSSYLTLVERKLGQAMEPSIREYMDFAIDGAKRMDRLILDLLEYSRVGRHGEGTEPVALDQVVADCLMNLKLAIEEGHCTVEVQDGLPTVEGNAIELVRLFQNLIGNAIKYRAPDRDPLIRVAAHAVGPDWVISVKDKGIGIDPKDHDRAFAVFQRLVGRDQYEGTGIGLAICRKIVEHHGGRIWIESTPGEGSTFLFTIPRHRQPRPAP